MICLSTCLCMCYMYGLFIKCFSTGVNSHVLNSLICKLLYMKTVSNQTCDRKAYTCRLFHIWSHIKCYFCLNLESFRRIDVTIFTSVPFKMVIIFPAAIFSSLFINMVYNSSRERYISSIPMYTPMFFSNSTHSSACGSWFHFKYLDDFGTAFQEVYPQY